MLGRQPKMTVRCRPVADVGCFGQAAHAAQTLVGYETNLIFARYRAVHEQGDRLLISSGLSLKIAGH